MDTLTVTDGTTDYVPKSYRGKITLTKTQLSIVAAAKAGQILIVYRSHAPHGKGCTFLSGFLCCRCDWNRCHFPYSLKHLHQCISDGKDIIIDCPYAICSMKARRNNFFKRIQTVLNTGFTNRIILMMHGEPLPMHSTPGYTLMDITNAPKAPYI